MSHSSTSNFLTIKFKNSMLRNIIPLFFLVVLGFSCNTEDYEVVPEDRPTPPEEEETTDESSDPVGATACADCDYIIAPNQYLVDNNELNLPAGSKIGIQGKNRNGIYLINFHGTAEEPFIVVNCDGQTTITAGSVGIKLHESSFMRITGTGSSDKYGIKISASLHGIMAEHGATDFEIDHVEISNSSSIGFAARSNPEPSTNRDNFVQRNTLIHDNYIHDVGNEGLYIGGSHWSDETKKEPVLKGVRVYNNHVENTGYDGIQVGSAIEDAEVYNNVIINYGYKNVTYHQSGLQANPGTTAKFYNNLIKGGTGNGIFLTGFSNDVYNNVVVDCNKYGMYIKDMDPLPNQSYRIFNNTMVNVGRAAVKMTSSQSVNNLFYNNVLINAAGGVEKDSHMDFSLSNNFTSAVIADARFADPTNLDFRPTANSPLVDAGIAINTIGTLLEDYLFNNRISGGKIDIGAFEFQN